MEHTNLIFKEDYIRKRLLPLDSPSRLSLKDDKFVNSAITFLIVPYKDKPYDLVLIRRTHSDMDKHSGEMSFPGGKQDPQDYTLEETALRECEEEIGVPRKKIHVLGSFDDHITPQKFIITPIVCFIDQKQKLLKCDDEVHEILKIPIKFFVNKKSYRERTYELNGDTIGVGKFNYKDSNGKKYVIFGATCHIIATYVDLVHNAGLVKPSVRRLSPADFNAREEKIKKE